MSRTITVSNEVYATIVARRKTKEESENTILSWVLATAGNAKEVHAHVHHDAHLILDSEINHKAE